MYVILTISLPPHTHTHTHTHTHSQYFYYSAMLAMIGTAMFIRMNWIIKAVLNLIALIIFIVVVNAIRPCLFDNFDKTVYGICRSCNEFVEIRVEAGVLLAALFVATVILGRSVSVYVHVLAVLARQSNWPLLVCVCMYVCT